MEKGFSTPIFPKFQAIPFLPERASMLRHCHKASLLVLRHKVFTLPWTLPDSHAAGSLRWEAPP